MLWEIDCALRWVDYAVCAFPQCLFKVWDDDCRLGDESVCEDFVELDEMADIDITVVLF